MSPATAATTAAGGEAPGLAPDPLPVPGIVDELRGGDADGVQIIQKAELGQLAYGVGQDVDANAELIHGRRGLVDLHVLDASVAER